MVAKPVPFGATAEAYCRPLELRVPAVSVHASRAERNLLFRAMADTDRLVAISACDAGDGPFSGLFAVPKDLDRDRLILDARPPNSGPVTLDFEHGDSKLLERH